jgi:NAD(P)-dependent dehydrogenase (short-subunit alcohol dehydrogenase family)
MSAHGKDAEPVTGRAFVLTGATGHLGEYVARHLVARGDHVMLGGRDEGRLRALHDRLDGAAATAFCTADVLEPAEADTAAARARERFGRLDGLVHLVGAFHVGTPASLVAPNVYLDLYRSNVLSAVASTAAVLPHLDAGGYLVYLSSLLAEQPMAAAAPYAAAKSALHAWVRALSREVKERGVHANVIVTSRIDTPARRAQFPGADYSTWVRGDDLAALVAALTSPAAAALHGAIVPAVGTFALEPPAGAVRRELAGGPR